MKSAHKRGVVDNRTARRLARTRRDLLDFAARLPASRDDSLVWASWEVVEGVRMTVQTTRFEGPKARRVARRVEREARGLIRAVKQ